MVHVPLLEAIFGPGDSRLLVLAAVAVILVLSSIIAGSEGTQVNTGTQERNVVPDAVGSRGSFSDAQGDREFAPLQQFLQAALADCGVKAVKCARVGQILEVVVVASHFGRVVRGGRSYSLEREASRAFGKALGVSFVSICSESDCEQIH